MFDTAGLDQEIVAKIDALYSIPSDSEFLRDARFELFDKLNYELGGQTGSPSDKRRELCYLWDSSARVAAEEGDTESELVSLEIAASVAEEFSKDLANEYLARLSALRQAISLQESPLGQEAFEECLKTGTVDEILVTAEVFLTSPDGNRDHYEQIGTALYFRERKDLAAQYWQRGAATGHARCAYLLGELALEQSDTNLARDYYQAALKLGYDSAQNRLNEINGKST